MGGVCSGTWTRRSKPRSTSTCRAGAPPLSGPEYWPLQDIFFYIETCVHESIILSFLPPTCIAYTVAILLLLHDYWALYKTPPRPPLCVTCTIQYWQ